MSKREMLKTLDNSSYVSLIAGAILVFIFEFTASLLLLRLSIILFGAAFLILGVLCVMKLKYMKNETKEDDELLVDKNKESKPWTIVRLVISAIFFALMIAFLCLF
jgi:Ca2+/Na+ antiporter